MIKLVFAHDTVRVIECLFEKASQEVKDALFNELKSHTINLARSQYAHFYLLKVLRHGNKEQRNYIIEALSGKVVYLMKHKVTLYFRFFGFRLMLIYFVNLNSIFFKDRSQSSWDSLQRLGQCHSKSLAESRILRTRIQAV